MQRTKERIDAVKCVVQATGALSTPSNFQDVMKQNRSWKWITEPVRLCWNVKLGQREFRKTKTHASVPIPCLLSEARFVLVFTCSDQLSDMSTYARARGDDSEPLSPMKG